MPQLQTKDHIKPPKWNPLTVNPNIVWQEPASGQQMTNAQAIENNNQMTSELSANPPQNLTDSFRIFMTPGQQPVQPATDTQGPAEEITVYTSGSSLNSSNDDAAAGSGIWFAQYDERNTALRVPGKTQSKQAGEIMAVLHVAKVTSPTTPLHIKTDSKYVINGHKPTVPTILPLFSSAPAPTEQLVPLILSTATNPPTSTLAAALNSKTPLIS